MQRLIKDIKTGELGHLYLLYGEEAYLRKQYKDKLKQAILGEDTMNFNYYEGRDLSVGEIIDQAETMPFFAEKRLLLVENSGLFKTGGEQMAEYLKEPPEYTYFVFVETEVDKRSRLFKTVQSKGSAVEFAVQDETTLKRWILQMMKRENKKISERTLNYLLETTGTDMENIHKECEKLFSYCMNEEVITEQAVDEICTKRITSHIFDMVGAIADKQQKKALELYYELLALKEPPMRILFLIARQFNILLQVKELVKKGYGNKAIGDRIGLPGFIAGKYVTQAAHFEKTTLREALENCVSTEEAIKTGRITDHMGLEMILIRYSTAD